jgi:hypothetical protein
MIKNLGAIKEKGINCCIFIQRHNKLFFIILVFLIFSAAGIIFYKYAYDVAPSSGNFQVQNIKIDEQLYKKVMDNFKQKEQRVLEAGNKTYLDPFK